MKPFEQRYAEALADENIRTGLLDFQRGWRVARDAQIAELEERTGRSFAELRADLAARKDRVLADRDRYLDTFRAAAEAAGATVVRAGSAAEANAYVADLAESRGTDLVVKGKSMVSEEIGLNEHLAVRGVAAVETDLGEWILQLAGEHPSHLVMPAIHKRAPQIARVLEDTLGGEFPPDDIDHMVKAARTGLRARFLRSGMGLSGANALVAESGAVMLVCNEGNNRMSVALPPVHVVLAGIEKLVATYEDAFAQVRLLARSATGQPITVYTNFVVGARPGAEMHIVLLDNGRTGMAAEPGIAPALRCIRCGACANVCPPYQIVGGHAFGHVYTGAIGLVNTLWHHGAEAAAGPQSLCVSCGACATVCPVDIPLPAQILDVRNRVADEEPERAASAARSFALRAFRKRRVFGGIVRVAGLLSGPFAEKGHLPTPRVLARLPVVAQQTSWRRPPAPAARPARALLRPGRQPEVRALAESEVTGRTVLLFLQCVTDRFAPDVAVATARLLRAAGARVVLRRAQHCCGLPAFDAGAWDTAAAMVRETIAAMEGVDDVVTPAPSCVVMLAHEAPRLFRDPQTRAQAEQLARRTYDIVGYLTGPARLPAGALDSGDRTPVTVHRFCQSVNTLERRDEIEELIRDLAGAPVVPLPEATVCCGFGGSSSVANPEVAAGILERKLDNVERTGARLLVTDNPGCMLHLRGGGAARGSGVGVRHVAEYLAGRLPDPGA